MVSGSSDLFEISEYGYTSDDEVSVREGLSIGVDSPTTYGSPAEAARCRPASTSPACPARQTSGGEVIVRDYRFSEYVVPRPATGSFRGLRRCRMRDKVDGVWRMM
ncbi:hypothetical protein CORC01_07863 [Colletotrichum orchidophilum]|uniref:Uncharacterized protein n=1 Tax=Colletotrichum orchidophilum TaxID=1209926 RepID=A0A1G4B6E9_9PEZI|nr:uncharacterized protein CORC01_07863 [Colletotrichum orchidophilum]OHE96896.1 hypothetical protein CORC01_07863 [Colletotrichum orchidophilum]